MASFIDIYAHRCSAYGATWRFIVHVPHQARCWRSSWRLTQPHTKHHTKRYVDFYFNFYYINVNRKWLGLPQHHDRSLVTRTFVSSSTFRQWTGHKRVAKSEKPTLEQIWNAHDQVVQTVKYRHGLSFKRSDAEGTNLWSGDYEKRGSISSKLIYCNTNC